MKRLCFRTNQHSFPKVGKDDQRTLIAALRAALRLAETGHLRAEVEFYRSTDSYIGSPGSSNSTVNVSFSVDALDLERFTPMEPSTPRDLVPADVYEPPVKKLTRGKIVFDAVPIDDD